MAAEDYYDRTDSEPAQYPVAVRFDGEIVEKAEKSDALVASTTTPAQAKTDAIAALTMQAYAKASELKLTPEEDKALGADFGDEAFRGGAGGDERLIYIEHAFLRDRLNDVLGRGQWSLVVRSKWTENYKTSKGTDAVRVYAEVMLMVRGCFVAEAVGEMDYYPNNAKTTYADAIEGSKTAAFRRCAKDFGIGLQAWKKGWDEGWWERKRNPQREQASKQERPWSPPPEQAPPAGPDAALLKLAGEMSKQGIAAFQLFWEKTLSKAQRVLLKDHLQRLKTDALAAVPDRGDSYEGDQDH